MEDGAGRARQTGRSRLSEVRGGSASSRAGVKPSGRSAREAKEREGKGRDACRSLERGWSERKLRSGGYGTDER